MPETIEALVARARTAIVDVEAKLAHARATVGRSPSPADRQRKAEAAATLIRARLAVGPATERAILGSHRDARDALRTMLGRDEVARTPRGYCLVPAGLAVASL